jgi:hypothetical protein
VLGRRRSQNAFMLLSMTENFWKSVVKSMIARKQHKNKK